MQPVTHNGKPSPVPGYVLASLVDVFQPPPGDALAAAAWLHCSVLQRELLAGLASWLRQQGATALDVMQKQLVRPRWKHVGGG
jgi:hypothetical protein